GAVLAGQLDTLHDGGGAVDLRVEEDLPDADAQDGAVDGRQTVQLPRLREVALDRLVDRVELLGGTRDDVAGVGGDGGDAVHVDACQLDAVLHDGDGVDVAGLRLEEDVDGASARTVTGSVAAAVALGLLALVAGAVRAVGGLVLGVGQVSGPYALTRERYSPVRVSTLTTLPVSRNSGTWISAPDSRVAGLVPPVERSPCRPGS